MSRGRTVHRCQECGAGAPRWAGRCGGCGAWNSLVEELDVPPRRPGPAMGTRAPGPGAAAAAGEHPVPLAEVDAGGCEPLPTGVGELDRVLGGGLVPGSVSLLGGEPGIGKSTLLLQLLSSAADGGGRCLLVTAEESARQVRLRAERLGAAGARALWIVSETELGRIAHHVQEVSPTHLAVDSIQTVFDADLDSSPGSVAQVRHCAHHLVQLAKAANLATVLVGHVTKEGDLAGPRVLEHVVDTVLAFEGDRHHALRLLRAPKHRFGATGELGLFEMTEAGLVGVPEAAGLFLADRREGVPGSAVALTMAGRRPLVVEVQALVTPTNVPLPRRSAQGVDGGRLGLLLAVLEERAGVRIARCDVYASAAGGVRVAEPGADLALALALVSAGTGVALPADVVACAEVGLGGELRQVGHLGARLGEAARLGFRRALVAPSAPDPPAGVTALRAPTLAAAVDLVGLAHRRAPAAASA